jgi:hypothetical protein
MPNSSSPRLCKAGRTLREMIDDAYPSRDRKSDGWVGDARHSNRKSDHNPDAQGWVRAIDVDADLGFRDESWYLADQLRLAAKRDRRISYIIHKGQIASRRSGLRWRRFSGNPHDHHIHISFTKKGDQDGRRFNVPLLGGSDA